MVPTVLLLPALALVALSGGGASGAAMGPPSAAPDPHSPRSTPVNVNFADDELVDNRSKSVKLEGACTEQSCSLHCKARAHAAGRCDPDGTCVCRDLKQKGRCASLGFGCGGACPDPDECGAGAAGRASNVMNNNNILVMH